MNLETVRIDAKKFKSLKKLLHPEKVSVNSFIHFSDDLFADNSEKMNLVAAIDDNVVKLFESLGLDLQEADKGKTKYLTSLIQVSSIRHLLRDIQRSLKECSFQIVPGHMDIIKETYSLTDLYIYEIMKYNLAIHSLLLPLVKKYNENVQAFNDRIAEIQKSVPSDLIGYVTVQFRPEVKIKDESETATDRFANALEQYFEEGRGKYENNGTVMHRGDFHPINGWRYMFESIEKWMKRYHKYVK